MSVHPAIRLLHSRPPRARALADRDRHPYDCSPVRLASRTSWQYVASELAFDPQCAESMATRIRHSSCDQDFDHPELAVLGPSCEHPCSLFHGSAFEHDACEPVGPFSTCAAGLVCVAGQCRHPCDAMPGREGDSCFSGCEDGLYCFVDPNRPSEPGYCTRLPGPGLPCSPLGECHESARCDDRPNDEGPMCVRLGENGEPCTGHAQCLNGHCPAGHCSPPLAEGDECTTNLRCAEGLACQDGVCQRTAGELCYQPNPLD
jgi:hypothetical protein